MAELLLYGKRHWHEDLSTSGMDQFTLAMVNASYRKGDVISVRENGHYSSRHPWNKDKFLLIIVSNASVDDLKYLLDSYDTVIGEKTYPVKKRRYGITVGDFVFPPSTNTITINKNQLNLKIIDKVL